MDIQLLQLLLTAAVGVVIPSLQWLLKVAVFAQLDAVRASLDAQSRAVAAQLTGLVDQIHRLDTDLRIQDRAMAPIVAGDVIQRLGAIEQRVAALAAKVNGGSCA